MTLYDKAPYVNSVCHIALFTLRRKIILLNKMGAYQTDTEQQVCIPKPTVVGMRAS